MASFQHHDERVVMSGGARGSWSSVTSRFQSDSPLSPRAEHLERTSKIHSSGARERENYPLLLRRRSSGEIFQISPPPSSPPLAIQRSAKRRGCLLSYSQAEPGRELTQPSPCLFAEPCNTIGDI